MPWFPTLDRKIIAIVGISIRMNNKNKFDLLNLFLSDDSSISYPNTNSDIDICKTKDRIVISMNNDKTLFTFSKNLIDIINYEKFISYKITKKQYKIIAEDILRILTEVRQMNSKLIVKKKTCYSLINISVL